MRTNRERMAVLVVCAIVAGCASMRRMPAETSEHQRELNHGYSLLYNVVNKQADIAKIFFLKRPTETTRALIEEIAAASLDAKKQLETFAEADPALALDDQGLPVVEANTRTTVEGTIRNKLLFGDSFDTRLLLTQVESSNYVAHLARELAKRDDNTERVAALNKIGDRFEAINDKVVARLSAPAASATASP